MIEGKSDDNIMEYNIRGGSGREEKRSEYNRIEEMII